MIKNRINDLIQNSFIGSFFDFELHDINNENIKELIAKSILVEDSCMINYKIDEETRKQFNILNNDGLNEYPIKYNSRFYVWNGTMLGVIYLSLKTFVEEVASDPFFKITKIEHNLNRYLTIEEKIKFLKSQYTEIYSKDVEYSLYIGARNPYSQFTDWESYIIYALSNSRPFLCNYMKLDMPKFTKHEELDIITEYIENCKAHITKVLNSIKYIDEDFFYIIHEWIKFYECETQCGWIKSKIVELLEQEVSSDKSEAVNNLKYSRMDIGYYCYYMKEVKEKFTENIFPSVKAYKELQEIYGPNWKNIQMVFNKISIDKSVRLTKRRDKKIEKILPLLTDEAKKLAKIELDIIKQHW